MEVLEIQGEIAEGVRYTYRTLRGAVPGSFICVRQGDTIEFHRNNRPDSKMLHYIVVHGAVGPAGGAASSFTAPRCVQFVMTSLNSGRDTQEKLERIASDHWLYTARSKELSESDPRILGALQVDMP